MKRRNKIKKLDELTKAKEELNELLNDFVAGKPLKRSKGIDDLAKRIASQMYSHMPKNVKEWANKLADDLSKIKEE